MTRSAAIRCFVGATVAVLSVAVSGPAALAKNIDLSTVPDRQTVQLTIYNSEDLTLVRETRKVSFKPGVNPLQFSWTNTLIDPTSVELRFLDHPDKLDVLDTTFPHDKPQMLTWNVESEIDGEATVEISYFTSGISWSADYVATADEKETEVRFEGFVRVNNNSGEEYEDAQIRLVVGRINLVEKIAQLARLPMSEVASLEDGKRRQLKEQVLRGAIGGAMPKGAEEPGAEAAAKPKEIVKEGLSEYFIYTIEGTETIPNGWSKRMRSLKPAAVPLDIEYRYRPQEYGDRLVRMYLMRNDKESNLGTTPLPDGVARVFRRTGHGTLSFLAAQSIPYIAIGDKIELNLGVDREVIFELVKLDVWRDTIWMQLHGADIFRRVDDGAIKIEPNSSVAGLDEHTLYAQRVRNYTAKPIKLEVRRTLPGHVVFRSELDARLHDYQTVEYRATVDAGARRDLRYEVVQHQGHNQQQDNVTIEKAEPKRP